VPKDGDHSQAVKCNHCSKFFASTDFLKKHYAKKHPEANYNADFPTKEKVEKQKEDAAKQLALQQEQQ
tara:strand:+ start:436 stop:639 length:204 start_codon:yes stop_codon:yes gene_type:complete